MLPNKMTDTTTRGAILSSAPMELGAVMVLTALIFIIAAESILQQTAKAQQISPQQLEQTREMFAFFEQQLIQSNPQQQRNMIAYAQEQVIMPILASSPNPQEFAARIAILYQVMSPHLVQILVTPVVNQLNAAAASQPPEQQAYHLGYNIGFNQGTTAEPSLCDLTMGLTRIPSDPCNLRDQYPQAYSQGYQDGLTAAGEAIGRGEANPPIGGGGSWGNWNPL